MAAAISCMRALPAGRRRIVVVENAPYSTASTPAAIAAHSHWVASIRKSPPEKRPRTIARRARRPAAGAGVAAPQQGGSDLEFVLELAPHRQALDAHVVG